MSLDNRNLIFVLLTLGGEKSRPWPSFTDRANLRQKMVCALFVALFALVKMLRARSDFPLHQGCGNCSVFPQHARVTLDRTLYHPHSVDNFAEF